MYVDKTYLLLLYFAATTTLNQVIMKRKNCFQCLIMFMFSMFFIDDIEAQKFKDGKLWLNKDGSNYFKATLLGQFWLRNTNMNPGSTINGYAKR